MPEIEGKRPGERLALALRALGPAFIKLGQMLSVPFFLLGAGVMVWSLRARNPAFHPGKERTAARP